MTDPTARLEQEVAAMWLRLARQTKAIVKTGEDWAGENPAQTADLIKWAEYAEYCFRQAANAKRRSMS